MSPFDVSASDVYLAAAILGLTLAVSAWFVLLAVALGIALIVMEFNQ